MWKELHEEQPTLVDNLRKQTVPSTVADWLQRPDKATQLVQFEKSLLIGSAETSFSFGYVSSMYGTRRYSYGEAVTGPTAAIPTGTISTMCFVGELRLHCKNNV